MRFRCECSARWFAPPWADTTEHAVDACRLCDDRRTEPVNAVKCPCCNGKGGWANEFTGCDNHDSGICACARGSDWAACGFCDGLGGFILGAIKPLDREGFARRLSAALGYPAPVVEPPPSEVDSDAPW